LSDEAANPNTTKQISIDEAIVSLQGGHDYDIADGVNVTLQ
jgi:hypothetical protein